MQQLLVRELKGATYRLLDLELGTEIRAFQRDFENVDFIVGTLFECDYEAGAILQTLTIHNEIIGDSEKERIELPIDDYKVGGLNRLCANSKFWQTLCQKREKNGLCIF